MHLLFKEVRHNPLLWLLAFVPALFAGEALAPDAHTLLFVLSVLEDLPAVEVSAALGLPVAKVYSRVHALREGVKRALAARGSDHG